MSLQLPSNSHMLTTEQIKNLRPGDHVFHTEWGPGIFRERRLDAGGNEYFIIDNYRGDLVMKDLNGDLFIVDESNDERYSKNTNGTNLSDSRQTYRDNPDNDTFLNRVEDDLDALAGQLSDNRDDVVSMDSVKTHQIQTSDLLAKINREIEFTEEKLKKLNNLRQSLYTHLGKVGHFLNEGTPSNESGIFKNENVDKAKTFLQKESRRFYEELKEEITDLKNSFGVFRDKRKDV